MMAPRQSTRMEPALNTENNDVDAQDRNTVWRNWNSPKGGDGRRIFSVESGPEDRHDLGYLANLRLKFCTFPVRSDRGRDMSHSTDARDQGITKSRTEGETPREREWTPRLPPVKCFLPDEGGR